MIPAILSVDLGPSSVKPAIDDHSGVDHSGALRGTGSGTIEPMLGNGGVAERSPRRCRVGPSTPSSLNLPLAAMMVPVPCPSHPINTIRARQASF